jgi:hypothetical protein
MGGKGGFDEVDLVEGQFKFRQEGVLFAPDDGNARDIDLDGGAMFVTSLVDFIRVRVLG